LDDYIELLYEEVPAKIKGQSILKCPFGVFKSPKKTNGIFLRISALASKKRSNQKSSVRVKTKSSY
jgi:hypothetical protein